jgi:diguanylate cyclase (GGDEF)-like protein
MMLEEEVESRTQELGQRNQDLEIANKQLTHASMTDALTGLHNRHYLYHYRESLIASLNRLYSRIDKEPDSVATVQKEGSIYFMMIDLDGFKIINDTYGHAAGDEALIQVRDVLRESTRDADTIVRWGGDEFLVVGDSESPDGAEYMAERIRMGLSQHDYLLGGGKVGYLTGSIGIAHFPFNPHQPRQFTWEQVVGLADQAAYVAKYNGRNAWVSFSGNELTEQSDLMLMKDSLSSVVVKKHITMTTSIEGEIELDFASGINTVTAKDLRLIR